jgi:SRSO17 transposase
MDAETIRGLETALDDYLAQFSDCFARRDTRAHLPVYVGGQLSDLPRKSVEPIALAAERPVRTLQEFLTQLTWNADRMRTRVAEIVVRDHGEGETIGLIDETGWVKKGDRTPGVQRQYCGAVGKQENCLITVHLGYATGDFHCLLDGDLYLPQSWHEDRVRCRAAGIPDDVVYRPKSAIALELYDRARAHGVRFDWLTFDEWYGTKPEFLRALDRRGQNFVAEVHQGVVAWIEPPAVTTRPYRRGGRGRPRKTPRLQAGSRPPQSLGELARSHPALRDQAWQAYRIKDTHKGPLVWQVQHALVALKDEQGLPSPPHHLLVGQHPLTGEIKYFLSNGPVDTPVTTLLRVAFSRWRVERCFEDHKGQIGLDHWEGRRWLGLKRHLILSTVSYLFLAQANHRLAGKKSGPDGVPGPRGDQRGRAGAAPETSRRPRAVRMRRETAPVPSSPQRPRPSVAHQHHPTPTATIRLPTQSTSPLR